jgi:hypothetical protein
MKVYIITCGNIERKNKMIEQLKKANITNYEFFGKIKHGTHYELDELLEIGRKEGLFFEKRKATKDTNRFKNGISCGLNHYYAMLDAYNNGLNKVCIMEDDIEFEKDFNLNIELPNDCHLFYFYSMANLNEMKEGMNKVVKPIYGFQAYIIKDPLLVINEIKKNSKTDTIDSMVAYQKCLKNKKYFIYPYMVSTDMIKYKSLVRN